MEKVIQKLSSCFKNQQGELISNFLSKELKNENIKKQTSSVGNFLNSSKPYTLEAILRTNIPEPFDEIIVLFFQSVFSKTLKEKYEKLENCLRFELKY
jgi:hypothetical protein